MAWIQKLYLTSEDQKFDWRASPLRAPSVARVAPALVQTAGFDPLRDEGAAYAARLKEAGVAVELIDYPGMIHGFIRAIGAIDVAQQAVDDGVKALKSAFAA